jgi:hypothetical protein
VLWESRGEALELQECSQVFDLVRLRIEGGSRTGGFRKVRWGDAALIGLVRKYPDTLDRLESRSASA